MTKAVYQSMYVFLSVLLLAVFFILSPSSDKQVSAFQDEIKLQFTKAATQLVMGGESFAEPFKIVWATTEDFYDQTATEALALLQPDETFTELVMMFDQEYQTNMLVAFAPIVLNGNEEPLLNIVPMDNNLTILDPNFDEDAAYRELSGGLVAGTSVESDPEEPEPLPVVWTNIYDSITGKPFCVAMFNGESNYYPGLCAVETSSEAHIYEN